MIVFWERALAQLEGGSYLLQFQTLDDSGEQVSSVTSFPLFLPLCKPDPQTPPNIFRSRRNEDSQPPPSPAHLSLPTHTLGNSPSLARSPANPTCLASPPKKKGEGHFPFFFFSQRFAFVDSKWKLYSLFMTQLGFLTSLLVWDNRSIQRVIKKIKFRRVVKERGS